nr:MAG TPA: hypothetical protein [Caudoviricetes sp.]
MLNMNLGERRVITVEITACDGGSFDIANPTYALIFKKEMVDSGVPLLEGHEMTVTVEPKIAGSYTLELKFEVASEIIVRKQIISVIE